MKFLFATDGSRGATAAEDFLLSLPLSCADDVVVVTTPQTGEAGAIALLSRTRWRFSQRAVSASTELRSGRAVDAISAAAFENVPDVVVVGSRGLGTVTGALLGSVARELLRVAPAPLLIVRGRSDAPRNIVVAIDGSADARAAVGLMAHFPLPSNAHVALLHVIESTSDIADEESDLRDPAARTALRDAHEREGLRLLAHARALLGPRVLSQDFVERHAMVSQLRRYADGVGADLVVLASRGQTHGGGVLGTSIADDIIGHAHCPVLVVKSRLRTQAVLPAEAHAMAAI